MHGYVSLLTRRWRSLLLVLSAAALLAAVCSPAQAAPFVYVTNFTSGTISQFKVGSGGLLAPLSPKTVAAGGSPTGIAISPNGKNAYAAADGAGVFQYDVRGGGALSPKSPPSLPAGNLPRDVVVSPDGKSVYVSNAGIDLPSSISQYDVGPDGSLSPKSPPSIDACGFAIAISPDGKNVYVVCGDSVATSQYRVGSDGTLSFNSFVEDDTSPSDVVVSPDGKSVYTGFLGISQWDVGAGGELAQKSPPRVGGNRLGGNLAVSPDGRSLYRSITPGNGFAGNQIDQYDIAAGGTLIPKDPATVDAGAYPRGLALTPDGRNLYVANYRSSDVSQYDVASDGTLSPKTPLTVPAGQGPWGIAIAGLPTLRFTFSPSTVPKTTYQAGSLATTVSTRYTNPGNNNPGGAVDRTQIYLDKNWKINPAAATKCSSTQLQGKTMAQAMAACKNALVGSGTATATANGQFEVHGCVLLFNGQPSGGLPTLQVFTRIQGSNPSTISCANPASNTQGNATVLLTGVLRPATAPYGKVLDVNNITQSWGLPLETFKTTIKHGNYISAKCPTTPWHMKTTWTYNNNTKKTVRKTQPCT